MEPCRLFHNLTGAGQCPGLQPAAPCDQIMAHFQTKIEAIHTDLDPLSVTISQTKITSGSSCSVILGQFQPVMPDGVLARIKATTSQSDPCPSWILKSARMATVKWSFWSLNSSLKGEAMFLGGGPNSSRHYL